MKAPGFWYGHSIGSAAVSVALAPLGAIWSVGAAMRAIGSKPARAPLPVICVGNIVAGGAGKTPVAMSLAHRIAGAHFLSRGHGGLTEGPHFVDVARDDHRAVGDEPLLLARIAPCWVARDRFAGARAAARAGARCVIMDDGYQDPSLFKDVSFLIVDGQVGFGSGRCIPAGPLRESIGAGLARAQAVVLLGDDRTGVLSRLRGRPVILARLEPEAEAANLASQRVIAFAGIGRPPKFFATLESLGANLVERHAFPDHHPYTPAEIGHLIDASESRSAALVTTSKDFVRVPPHQRDRVTVIRIAVAWDDEAALMRILAPALGRSA
jgi:tetraacyldisaccharide 4'-kinase